MHSISCAKMPPMNKELTLTYEVYESIDELNAEDRDLLQQARKATELAYVPYSHFRVGATARMENGATINGSNQENASYPVGICAERVLLSAVSSVYPGLSIQTMAISYYNENGGSSGSEDPVAPCGMCRQSIFEFETRFNKPIRLILSGLSGKVVILPSVTTLLPMAFSGKELL